MIASHPSPATGRGLGERTTGQHGCRTCVAPPCRTPVAGGCRTRYRTLSHPASHVRAGAHVASAVAHTRKIVFGFFPLPRAAVRTYAHARGRANQPGPPEPRQAPVIGGHPATDWVHLTCCRLDVFLCGIEAPAAGVLTDVPEEAICPACRVVDERGLPCPVPGCSP